MRPERSKVSVEKYKSCEHHQARTIGLTESQRSHHTEQRPSAHLTKVLPTKHLIMVLRLALSRLSQPTSQDHSSFHKSPSAQLHHPSQVPQATTEPRHGQENPTRPTATRRVSIPLLSPSADFIADPIAFAATISLSLRESESMS